MTLFRLIGEAKGVKENNPVESKDRIHKNSCDIACSLRRDVIQGIQFVHATVPPFCRFMLGFT